jgi:hypothetical protein
MRCLKIQLIFWCWLSLTANAAQEIDPSKFSSNILNNPKQQDLLKKKEFDSRMHLQQFSAIDPNSSVEVKRKNICNLGFIHINYGINSIRQLPLEQKMCLDDWSQWYDHNLPWDIQGVNLSTPIQKLLDEKGLNCSFKHAEPMVKVDVPASSNMEIFEIPLFCSMESWDYSVIFFRVMPQQKVIYINQILSKACISLPYLNADSDTYRLIEKKYKSSSKEFRVKSKKAGEVFEVNSSLIPVGGITSITVKFKNNDDLHVRANVADKECKGQPSLTALFMNEGREIYIKDKHSEAKRNHHEKHQPTIKF